MRRLIAIFSLSSAILAANEICLDKISYKSTGEFSPKTEYELSQIYDSKNNILEKIYDSRSESGNYRSKSIIKFDKYGERD